MLPARLLSGLARRVSRCRWRGFKNAFIRIFTRAFNVDLADARSADPADYDCFDAFFTRALKPGARAIAQARLTCPSDGTISQIGDIADGVLIQAKGKTFSAIELLADETMGALFKNGRFATIYLSPRDYHRVHMPAGGTLRREIHVPGRLFSVSERHVRKIPGLFARNERLVMLFDTETGPLAVVMVAAVLVSGMQTVFRPGIYPPARKISELPLPAQRHLEQGSELGRFHWGSTVIVLTPPGSPLWLEKLKPGARVQMGQALTI